MTRSRTLALGLLLLWGCGGDGGSDCDPIAATLVSRIEVTPATATVPNGGTVQLAATAYSCDESQLPLPPVTWQSADASTVSVTTSGMALGVKLGGPVEITATAQGKQGAARISVAPRSVASVQVEPASATVAVGRTSTLVAKAFDASGNELPGRTATWSSADDAVVTVAASGAITGVSVGGPIGVTATIEGQSATAQVSVVAVAVASVTVSPATADVPAGTTLQLEVVLRDDQGAVLTGRAVLWTSTDAARASVSSATGLVTGVALGGPVTIVATSEGRSGQSQVTVVPGAAARLAFTVQPRTVVAGAAISPDVKVEVRDASGNRVPTSTASVTMSLGSNPGPGVLTGTRTVNAVAGVATFTNLKINQAGNGYTLSAGSSGLTSATSTSFDVTPGVPAAMRFGVQPSSVVAGAEILPAITVELLDGQGNLATSSSPQVTLSLGSNPGGATLNGTASVNAVAGVATFSGMSLNQAGTGYTLVAASPGLQVATSAAFNVTPGVPATLTFTMQPGNVVAGDPMSMVQVAVRDASGNVVTSPETEVTLSLGDTPGGATLGGTTVVTTMGGVATFDGLSVDVAGTGYTLVANAAGLMATSSAFDVTPGPPTQLGFSVQPTNVSEGAPFSPPVAVEVRDKLGNRVSSFEGNVSLELLSETGGTNRLLNGGKRDFVQGLAVFSGLTVDFRGSGPAVRTFTIQTKGAKGSIEEITSNVFTVSAL